MRVCLTSDARLRISYRVFVLGGLRGVREVGYEDWHGCEVWHGYEVTLGDEIAVNDIARSSIDEIAVNDIASGFAHRKSK